MNPYNPDQKSELTRIERWLWVVVALVVLTVAWAQLYRHNQEQRRQEQFVLVEEMSLIELSGLPADGVEYRNSEFYVRRKYLPLLKWKEKKL